jgi:phosphonatase-like hydrolase
MAPQIKLAVFDMAGTTVIDRDEVLACFSAACKQAGLMFPDERLNALMGVSKLEVFVTLWREQLGPESTQEAVLAHADRTFLQFKDILETYYRENPVEPVPGAVELFQWLRSNGIKVALNTGFYRDVTDIILQKLGWDRGLNDQHIGGADSVINFSISSDEVPAGRPQPFMIQKAMSVFGIEDSKQVLKVGDTPVDLQEGRNANVAYNLAVLDGTHSRAQLEVYENDGLLPTLKAVKTFLETNAGFNP